MWASVLGNVLPAPVALIPTPCNGYHSCWWRNWSKQCHWTGVAGLILHSNCTYALCRSASVHLVTACWTLFRCTWNCLHCVVVTVSAAYTWLSIAERILWILCSRNQWHSLADHSSTVAFTVVNIFYSQKAPFFWGNAFSASSSIGRDRLEWFCWLTCRENSNNACTAHITISSEVLFATVFPSSLEHSTIGAQITARVLIMSRMSFPCQELLFHTLNGIEKHWKPRSCGTDVNLLSNRSSTFLAFRYLSRQCNHCLTKH